MDVEDFKLDAAAVQPPKLVRPKVLTKLLMQVSQRIQYMSVSLRTGNRLCPAATPKLGFILGTAKAIPQYNPLGGSLRKSGAPDAYFIPVVLN